MPQGHVRIRRSRRTDFVAVMHLLAASGVPIPPPDRAALRRFRNLVSDLGADFYLASVEDTLAGLLYVTYARQLTVPPQARLDHLVVAEAFRGRGVGVALLAFAERRARQRGCGALSCALPTASAPLVRFLERGGLQRMGDWFVQELRPDLPTVEGHTEGVRG